MSVIAERITRRQELGLTADEFDNHLRRQAFKLGRNYKATVSSVLKLSLHCSETQLDEAQLELEIVKEEYETALEDARRFGALPRPKGK